MLIHRNHVGVSITINLTVQIRLAGVINVNQSISNDRKEESLEAKARWCQSLTMEERADLLCEFSDLLLSLNPQIVEKKDAQPIEGRIRVITKQ
jgi:hypothetical protein